MSSLVQARIEGADEIARRLAELPRVVRRRVLPRAVRAGAAVLVRSARSRVPVRYGYLKKSIGTRQRSYEGGDVSVVAIGPRTGRRVEIGQRRDGSPVTEDPSKIAHLVEFGHGGPAPAPPYPFMRPAYDQDGREAARVVRETVLAGIEAELRR